MEDIIKFMIIDIEVGNRFENSNSYIEVLEVMERPTCEFDYIRDTESPVSAVRYIENGEEKVDTSSFLAIKIINNEYKLI